MKRRFFTPNIRQNNFTNGSRLLKRWIVLPLKDIQQINEIRCRRVLIKDTEIHHNINHHIKQIGDLERLISKVPMGKK